jgi:hypothetical protein
VCSQQKRICTPFFSKKNFACLPSLYTCVAGIKLSFCVPYFCRCVTMYRILSFVSWFRSSLWSNFIPMSFHTSAYYLSGSFFVYFICYSVAVLLWSFVVCFGVQTPSPLLNCCTASILGIACAFNFAFICYLCKGLCLSESLFYSFR